MIERIANGIALFLYKNGATELENVDVVRYGIEVMISNTLSVLVIIIMSILLRTYVEGCIFMIGFIVLRQYTGGYHANTYWQCNLYFAITYYLTIEINRYSKLYELNWLLWIIVILGYSLVIVCSPIKNENRPLTDNETSKYRKLSVIIYGIVLLIATMLDIANIEYMADVSLYIKITLFSIIVLMLIAIAVNMMSTNREGEVKNEETVIIVNNQGR